MKRPQVPTPVKAGFFHFGFRVPISRRSAQMATPAIRKENRLRAAIRRLKCKQEESK